MRSDIKWTEKIENFDANKLNMLHKRRKLQLAEEEEEETYLQRIFVAQNNVD